MKVRRLYLDDLSELRDIHSKHYSKEFEFPDFITFMSSFVVTNDSGKVITGGGIKLIPESIIITDKDWPIEERRKALVEMFRASAFCCGVNGYDQLHAFIQDEKWLSHLKRFGFKETKGKSLYFNV